MNRLDLLAVLLATTIGVGGCSSRFARPVDSQTQYVSRTLVTERCLEQCDFSDDGMIQYHLWSDAAVLGVEDRGDNPFGVSESYGAVWGEVREVPSNFRTREVMDGVNAEYLCWNWCRGPEMVAAGGMLERERQGFQRTYQGAIHHRTGVQRYLDQQVQRYRVGDERYRSGFERYREGNVRTRVGTEGNPPAATTLGGRQSAEVTGQATDLN